MATAKSNSKPQAKKAKAPAKKATPTASKKK